jgi:hypothetical protein
VQTIHEITRIPIRVLQGVPLDEFDKEIRILWSHKRNTSRGEDKAYSLLGILGVLMLSIYGEGEEVALKRFRKEFCDHQDYPVRDPEFEASITRCIADLRLSDP